MKIEVIKVRIPVPRQEKWSEWRVWSHSCHIQYSSTTHGKFEQWMLVKYSELQATGNGGDPTTFRALLDLLGYATSILRSQSGSRYVNTGSILRGLQLLEIAISICCYVMVVSSCQLVRHVAGERVGWIYARRLNDFPWMDAVRADVAFEDIEWRIVKSL